MLHILLLSFIAALFISGFFYSMHYDVYGIDETHPYGKSIANSEIFGWFRHFLGSKLYNTPFRKLLKPLVTCTICASSVYGSLLYWTDVYLTTSVVDGVVILNWLIMVATTAGIGRVIDAHINK